METRTHTTAAVLIPPTELWGPIQAIRRVHDRQVWRWMPHITLLYPFRPREQFEALAAQLEQVCNRAGPFEVNLARFRYFQHNRHSATLWLDPEPKEPFVALQSLLLSVIPDCDDVNRHEGGFTPHLSVGQVRGNQALRELQGELQASWQPLSFTASTVSLIWRNLPPDDVFRAALEVPLGRQ
jgi:2'-5' RNA ligase